MSDKETILMSDKETILSYDQQASDYAKFVGETTSDDPVLSAFVECFSAGEFVLDLGCGPAHAAAQMRGAGLQVDPVDASIEMVKLANSTFAINARQADFSDIKTISVYDGVWANYSLLHASREDFPTLLAALRMSLKLGGLFHIAMKLGNGAARDNLGRLYQYYSQNELRDFLADAGFQINKVEQGEALGMAGKVEPWIAILSEAV